jgi:hypothetical protein
MSGSPAGIRTFDPLFNSSAGRPRFTPRKAAVLIIGRRGSASAAEPLSDLARAQPLLLRSYQGA